MVGRSEEELRNLRGNRIAMVYQDPMQALNPCLTLGDQVTEVLTTHHKIPKKQAWDWSIDMLNGVYMPDTAAVKDRYAHRVSGGQQQRVVIAMALLNNPALLIMDEPTTALDVTVEAVVLDLAEDLKRDSDSAIVYITHDLGVVARVLDYVGVMYAGQIAESGRVAEIYADSKHPYTHGLMRCVPKLGTSKDSSWPYPIRGRVPAPANRPKDACVFAPRCDYATERCQQEAPRLLELVPGHSARRFHAEEIDVSSWTPEEGLVTEFARPGDRDEMPILSI